MSEKHPRLSSACYSPSLDFPIARYPSVHFSNSSFVKGVVLRLFWYDLGGIDIGE